MTPRDDGQRRIGSKGVPRDGAAIEGQKARVHPRTDLGNAERLIEAYGNDYRWCHPYKRFLIWSGNRWVEDDSGGRPVMRYAMEVVRSIRNELDQTKEESEKTYKFSLASEGIAPLGAMIELSKSKPNMTVSPAQLDSHDHLLNLHNGTYDTSRNELIEPDRLHLLTKTCKVSYEPSARCPTWDRFMDEITAGNTDLQRFLQRVAGTCLSGHLFDHAVFFFHGGGRNGKGTFLRTMLRICADYGCFLRGNTLMIQKGQTIPSDIATMKGKRLVVTGEVPTGDRLDEGLLKSIISGDPITARRMHGDWFTFDPTHTLFMQGNSRPKIVGMDVGIWSKVRLVPFLVSFLGREDHQLDPKLEREDEGIFLWMLNGLHEVQRNGVGNCREVESATAEYRQDMDDYGAFIEECTVPDEFGDVYATALFEVYLRWCKVTNTRPCTQTTFGNEMKVRLERGQDKKGRKYEKLSIRESWQPSDRDQRLPYRND